MHIIKGESNINKKGISDHRRRKRGKKAHDQECKSMSISLTPIETNKSSGEDGNRISGLYIPLNYTSFSPVPCQQYAHHAVPPPGWCAYIFLQPILWHFSRFPQPRDCNLTSTFCVCARFLFTLRIYLEVSSRRKSSPTLWLRFLIFLFFEVKKK